MKKLLTLIVSLTFISCVNTTPEGYAKLKTLKGFTGSPILVEVDSCEYLVWDYKAVHKGDCKYCKERRKKEINEVLNALFKTNMHYDSVSSKND